MQYDFLYCSDQYLLQWFMHQFHYVDGGADVFWSSKTKVVQGIKVHLLPPSRKAARFWSSSRTLATCKPRAAENRDDLGTVPTKAFGAHQMPLLCTRGAGIQAAACTSGTPDFQEHVWRLIHSVGLLIFSHKQRMGLFVTLWGLPSYLQNSNATKHVAIS